MHNYQNLGILIEAIRRKDGFTISELLKDENGNICDRKTYKKMDKNIIIKKKDTYDRLLRRMGYTNSINYPQFNFTSFWKILETYDNILLRETINAYIDLCIENPLNNVYTHTLTYILGMFNDIIIKNKKLSNENIIFLVNVLNITKQDFTKCILVLLSYHLSYLEVSSYNKVVKVLFSSNELMHKIRVFKHFLNTHNYYDAMAIQIEIENHIAYSNNTIHILDFLDASSFLEYQTNSTKNTFNKRFIEMLMVNADSIPNNKYIQYYGNLGITALLKSNYYESISYLNKIKDYDTLRRITIYIYLYFCFNQLKILPPTELSKLPIVDEYSQDAIHLYQYFINKQINTNKQNRNSLLSLTKHISKSSTLYIRIIELEIYNLCGEAKKYSDYYEFIVILRKRKFLLNRLIDV